MGGVGSREGRRDGGAEGAPSLDLRRGAEVAGDAKGSPAPPDRPPENEECSGVRACGDADSGGPEPATEMSDTSGGLEMLPRFIFSWC